MNAGGPISSASTYMPSRASWTATRSETISVRTRPRTKRPRWGAAASGSVRVSGASAPSAGQLLTRAHQVVHVGIAAGFGAVRHTELPVRVGQVELDRLLGHPEL